MNSLLKKVNYLNKMDVLVNKKDGKLKKKIKFLDFFLFCLGF